VSTPVGAAPPARPWTRAAWLPRRGSPLARSVLETLGTRVVLLGLAMVANVLVARALGPAGRGYYGVAAAVTGLAVQFGTFGLHASNTFHVARGRGRVRLLVANSLLVALGLGGAIAAVCFGVFFYWPERAPLYGLPMVLALAAVPFSLAYVLLQSVLLGLEEFRACNKLEAALALFGLAWAAALVVAGRATVTTLLAGTVLGAVLVAGAALARLRPYLRGRVRPSRALLGSTLRYGLRGYAAGCFAYLVQRTDLLILDRVHGSRETGYYAAAVSVAMVLGVVPTALGTILFPRLSAMRDPEERWRVVARVLPRLAAVMAAAAALGALLAGPAVLLLFGAEFAPAVAPLRLLMPAVLLLSVNSVLMNYLASSGMPPVTVYSPAAATAVNVGLNLWLIPRLGGTGAAVSSLVAYACMVGFSVAYLRRERRRRGGG